MKVFRKHIALSLLLVLFVLPHLVFAQVCPGSGTETPLGGSPDFKQFACFFVDISIRLSSLLGTLAFFVFLFGLARFILAAGDEKKIEGGKKIMLWGVIALFIMFSIWGIIQILSNVFFGGGTVGIPILPQSRPGP